jgi:hypothetical protein
MPIVSPSATAEETPLTACTSAPPNQPEVTR